MKILMDSNIAIQYFTKYRLQSSLEHTIAYLGEKWNVIEGRRLWRNIDGIIMIHFVDINWLSKTVIYYNYIQIQQCKYFSKTLIAYICKKKLFCFELNEQKLQYQMKFIYMKRTR